MNDSYLPFDGIQIQNLKGVPNMLDIAFLWHGDVLARLHVKGAQLKLEDAGESITLRGIDGRQKVSLSVQ